MSQQDKKKSHNSQTKLVKNGIQKKELAGKTLFIHRSSVRKYEKTRKRVCLPCANAINQEPPFELAKSSFEKA